MILKLGMQHSGFEVFKMYMNDDPGMTLTYFTAISNMAAYVFKWEKLLQSPLKVKVSANKQVNRSVYVFEKHLTTGVCLPLPQGYVHDHYFQTSTSLKPLGQQSQISCGAVWESGKESLYKWSRSYDVDGRHTKTF